MRKDIIDIKEIEKERQYMYKIFLFFSFLSILSWIGVVINLKFIVVTIGFSFLSIVSLMKMIFWDLKTIMLTQTKQPEENNGN